MNPNVSDLDQHGAAPERALDRGTDLTDTLQTTIGSDHVKRVVENVEPSQLGTLRGSGEPTLEERVKPPDLDLERRSCDHFNSTSLYSLITSLFCPTLIVSHRSAPAA